MYLFQGIVFLIMYIYVLNDQKVLATSKYSPPEIVSEFDNEHEYIVEVNNNHTLFCQGNKPLKWTLPKVKKDKQSWTTFAQKPEKPINEEYQYGMTLQIINMSYPFVGFYYCHYENASTDNPTDSTNIYLFVNDPEHLTTLELDDAIEQVIVTQFQEAVIPCKPTSPDVHVSLFTFTTGTEIEDSTYDPKSGFKLFVSDLSQQQIYLCTFFRNSESVDALVHLTIHSSLPVSHLPLPYLQDLSGGHTIIGNNLVLECRIKSRNEVNFHWQTPSGPINSKRMERKIEKKDDTMWETLTIINTTKLDNGIYYCNVTDNQQHSSYAKLSVKIFNENENFITVTEENDIYSITESAKVPLVQWSITVNSHPEPSVIWINNINKTIPMENGTKYEAFYQSSTKRAVLKIKNLDITDYGPYTLQASNNITVKEVHLFLNVTDKPTVAINTEPFYMINTTNIVKCVAAANPEPEFEWYFKPCQLHNCNYMPINGTISLREGFLFESEVTIPATHSGYFKCFARNYLGNSSVIREFHVSDVKNGFDIYGFDSTVNINEEQRAATFAEGDTITAICGASSYNYSEITWFYNDTQLTYNNQQQTYRYQLTSSKTQYSNKLKLEIEHANKSDGGLYSCRVVKNNVYLYKNMTFIIENPTVPEIRNTSLKKEMLINTHTSLVMFCQVYGIPKPTLMWFKNGAPFLPFESKRIRISENNEKIIFSSTKAEDEGSYKCEVKNKMGVVSREQYLRFIDLPQAPIWLVTIIIILSLILIGTIVFIIIKTRKEKRLQRELKLLGLANFEKGAIENINPELGIDDQAELLPYDQKWEFPIERLKLGKQLGSGAFGVVMKGQAKNIVEDEDETTVAVKMVKKNADHTYIKALASELKIMVHLGKHLNVVNLLGACTKNVAKRELLVIVEFCRFGNLQNYLLKHRDNYIDQVDSKTGKIDYMIGHEFYDRTYSVSSDRSTQSPSLKYAALAFPNTGNQTVAQLPSNMVDYRSSPNIDTCPSTDMTIISQGEDTVILSNNSVQPEWRSNYKGDYKGNVRPICTKDLLAWAFQVARGMEYLASRKVLHGDLAARNILLADNNIVKICDFGLAKSMYKNDNYKKRGDGPLPVKWMAIESIRDRVFSTQSDVWSFGIVLWEFFSLARTPYPGMEADERLYQKLVDGYRMESPPYAPNEVYKMMTECWLSKPLARPSFTKLSEQLGNLLEDSLRKHYIDLNDPYLVMNTQRLENGHSDYLAMLSPPTYEALSTPHYVNEMVGQELFEDSGYLSMKPSAIFSPRVEEVGPMFDFNVNNRKHLNSEERNTMELLPMLRRQSDSGCETPLQSPNTPHSFSNPSYHIPPKFAEKHKSDGKDNSNIAKSSDNYVNMPQNKNIIKAKTNSQNNPFIDSKNETANEHYVNSNSKDWESIKM